MTKYDKALYDAWLDGFQQDWDHGRNLDWPVKWLLRQMYWAWRRTRAQR